ncbi:MAG: hypothetical protein Q9160_003280 [Pyrenula sp. 1 TL-2023]
MSQVTASNIKPAVPRKGIQRRAAVNVPSTTKKPEKQGPSQQAIKLTDQSLEPTTSSSKTCCGSPKIVIDDESGGRVCENCGAIVEGRQYVNEVGFTETSTGAAVATGQRVGQFETHARGAFDRRAQAFRRGDEPLDSAERTTQKAKKIITTLATSVRLSEVIQDEAVQVFRLCGPGSFLPGRTTTSVAVVCLYIACRRNPLDNAVLLIDLAEKTNTNVFKLGKLYTKIVDAMRFNEDLINKNNNQKIHIPKYAPESLIQRFVNELEFDRDKNRVMTDAVKVFKRMRRDWIAEGRRPAGVCAAAVILGGRMNNFRRTVREVVYVAKVCELTINKRLDEFKITDTGKMTVDEFRETDVEEGREHDPPAFTRSKEPKKPKTSKRGRSRKNAEGESAAEIEGDDPDTVTEESRPTKSRRLDKDGFTIPDIPLDPNLKDSQGSQGNQEGNGAQSIAGNQFGSPTVSPAQGIDDGPSQPSGPTPASGAPQEGPRKRGRPKGSKNRKLPLPTPGEAALEAEIEADVNQILERARPNDLTDSSEAGEASNRTEGQGPEQYQIWPKARDIPMDPDIDPKEFEDDPEVANCLLDDEESKAKEIIWVTENKEWLYKHMHNEFYRRKRELEGRKVGSGANKKRHPRGDVSYINREDQETEPREGETEDEATRRRALEAQIAMLKQRGTFSQAIDYWALADMGYDVRSHVGSSSSPTSSDRSRSGSRDAPSRPQTPFSSGSYAQGGSLTQRLNNATRRLRQSMSPSPRLSQGGRLSASPSPQPDRRRRVSASISVPANQRTRASASPLISPANGRLERKVSLSASPSPSPAPSGIQARDTTTDDRRSQPPPPPNRNIEEEVIREIVPIDNREIDTEDEEVYDDDELVGSEDNAEEDGVESALQGQYREDAHGDDNLDDDDW